jgi:excisionase family DNA binding protein
MKRPHASPAGETAPDRLLDLKEVASIMGLSVPTIRRAIRHRKLAVHRLGGAIRVSEADLQAFLTQRRQAAR